MRKTLLVISAAVVLSALAGCSKSTDAAPAQPTATKTDGLVVAKPAEPTEAPKEAQKAEESGKDAEAAKDTWDPVAAKDDEKSEKIKVLEAELGKAGFKVTMVHSLMPDKLGGLEDECAVKERTKIEVDGGYATLATYEDEKRVKTCFDAYMKMPGTEQYKNLYQVEGVYMLELHPKMPADAMSKAKEIFARVVKG
ncbi:hypothetical protein [Vulgatibacter incomptus]|uniref:Lipoprotein n=1 Tax=Vulgatibacter incomptus TaxID=1391653 RepID=A0A0K1PER4_9BACT|nr:hypothetical protein [Vulgatibacter incomptus]AKU91906.1 hypothetical protein AKJ08_2293 [Vulgatibacter incomptus]